MKRLSLRRSLAALAMVAAFFCQETWALAGTTGGLSGAVTDETGTPMSGASVKVVSASQVASTTTDASGHFTFISLTPDTYSVSAQKTGYSPESFDGVTVFADQAPTLSFRLQSALKTIAKVTSKTAGALVKAGTTSDVYSVNAATAAKVTGLGGGGSLDQAYSAIATMPGAYVPVGQMGWFQSVYIRGGDFDQVGYEVDGVPVNRAFDNYPSNTASALGQQEVQVYTGAAPSNAEGQGLSGFINQVIKSGTYPGFASSDLGLGAPTFYHKANVEAGGASPDRLFSYYAGFGGYNQSNRFYDSNNGASIQNLWGTPFAQCPAAAPANFTLPGCYDSSGTYEGSASSPWYVLGPFNYNGNAFISDRENVMNFHFAIPHHSNGGRDDLQVLWQGSDLKTFGYLAPSDWGTPAFFAAAGVNTPTYTSSNYYSGAIGQTMSTSAAPSAYAPVLGYGFPSAPSNVAFGGNIDPNTRDAIDNAVGIVKVQYQKNFGSDAYMRVYGYTSYSNWFNWGPNSAQDNFSGGVPTDYELFTHTRGLSATFAKQLTSKNLIQLQGSYSTATSTRENNTTMFTGDRTRLGILVDSLNPTSGICYTATGQAANCDSSAASFNVDTLNQAQQGKGALPTIAAGTTCNGNPCAWYLADNGFSGSYNTVAPKFGSGSVTDEWDPTDRLHINLGVRYDRFEYDTANTQGGTRPFWYNAWNNSYCHDANVLGSDPVEKTSPTDPCSSLGASFVPATQINADTTEAYTVVQPRVAFTYTLNPLNVLRFSYGKFDQAPNAAFEQYNVLQQNLPGYLGTKFYGLGFNTPSHAIPPEISFNTDASWEHQLKGTDMSWKVTPFFRKTNNQIQQFFLDLKTAFVSGLNVGAQTSEGVELQFQKGDFSKNGIAALVSYTYTNAFVQYQPAANGSTPVSGVNNAISQYNAFTSACNGGSAANTTQYGQPLCAAGVTAAPCYQNGAPVTQASSCTAGDVANPYWNAPAQGLDDPNGKYAPYTIFPNPNVGGGNYASFVAPHVATIVLNYKHDKFAITPALQFAAGNRYGYPNSTVGVDPSSCTAVLAGGTVSNDPRYPYGGYGSPYDVTKCTSTPYTGGSLSIPNPATLKFDGIGAFTSPARLTLATQLSYDVSPRISAVLTLANIFDRCFGGTKAAWTNVPGVSSSKVCGYGGGLAAGLIPPVGNAYNPPFSSVQPGFQQSYGPIIGSLPFNAYLDFKIKL